MSNGKPIGAPDIRRPLLVRKSKVMVSSIANPGGAERVAERSLAAFQLRKEGRTVREIAEKFGVSEKTISTDIAKIRGELLQDSLELAEVERNVMLGQLDQIISKFAPVVLDAEVAIMLDRDGKPALNADRIEAMSKAAAVILKAQERKAKLLGLDAPEKVAAVVATHAVSDEELIGRVEEQGPLVAALGGKIETYRQRVKRAPESDVIDIESTSESE